jgi:hypothetical protein
VVCEKLGGKMTIETALEIIGDSSRDTLLSMAAKVVADEYRRVQKWKNLGDRQVINLQQRLQEVEK